MTWLLKNAKNGRKEMKLEELHIENEDNGDLLK